MQKNLTGAIIFAITCEGHQDVLTVELFQTKRWEKTRNKIHQPAVHESFDAIV